MVVNRRQNLVQGHAGIASAAVARQRTRHLVADHFERIESIFPTHGCGKVLALWLQQGYIRRMSKTATIRTRIEPGLKSEVEDILARLGLTASETVHLLYRQIKLQRGLPFDVRIPNALTARTLNASKAGRGIKRFNTKRELYADLGL